MILNEISKEEAQKVCDRICVIYQREDLDPTSYDNTVYQKSQLLLKFGINNYIAKHIYSIECDDIT